MWGPVQQSSSLSLLLCLCWGWQSGKRLCCRSSPWCGKAGADGGGKKKRNSSNPFYPNLQTASALVMLSCCLQRSTPRVMTLQHPRCNASQCNTWHRVARSCQMEVGTW
eukprot:3933913-Rhodomonas_salina.1